VALILCHSPKGGVGTSFFAAYLSILLAERGHDVAALDFTYQDSLKLYFGVIPQQMLPEWRDDAAEATAVSGVQLFGAHNSSREQSFFDRLGRPGASPFDTGKLFIADVAAGDTATVSRLIPYATMQLCVLQPNPSSLATLPRLSLEGAAVDVTKTMLVLNHIDDTRRLSRHSLIFIRELFGDKLLGTIRRDEAVNESAAMFESIKKFAPTSVALADLRKITESVERHCGLTATVERVS
jgi:chromosome partitioning protein